LSQQTPPYPYSCILSGFMGGKCCELRAEDEAIAAFLLVFEMIVKIRETQAIARKSSPFDYTGNFCNVRRKYVARKGGVEGFISPTSRSREHNSMRSLSGDFEPADADIAGLRFQFLRGLGGEVHRADIRRRRHCFLRAQRARQTQAIWGTAPDFIKQRENTLNL
jgi:hypothetical protein